MGRPLDVDGLSWDEWADANFPDEGCDICGRGKEFHQPMLVKEHWFAKCFNTPIVKAVFYLWEPDETDHRDREDVTTVEAGDVGVIYDEEQGCYDGVFVSCKCYVVTHFITWDVRGQKSGQLHYFETPGLYGIIPPAAHDRDSESWDSIMTEIEEEESRDMRFILLHYGVDVESYDECRKLRKENW